MPLPDCPHKPTAEAEELADEILEIDDADLELDALRAERDELRDRFMRALADAENARKRTVALDPRTIHISTQ